MLFYFIKVLIRDFRNRVSQTIYNRKPIDIYFTINNLQIGNTEEIMNTCACWTYEYDYFQMVNELFTFHYILHKVNANLDYTPLLVNGLTLFDWKGAV